MADISKSQGPPADAPGARQFRRLVLGVSCLYALILAAACVNQYLAYRHAMRAPSENLYRGLQEQATLTYWAVWFVVSLLALLLALRKSTNWLAFYVNLLITAEAAAHGYYFATNRHFYRPFSPVLYGRFEPHPFVVAMPRPDMSFLGISHDAAGHRTTINEGKRADAKAVFIFGGSTAYDVGNKDPDTWPTQLSRLLGPGFVVTNLGVPAFSSAEAMTQSLFAFRDQPVACALYYEGWNDLRNSHVKDLRVDYSNFEYPNLVDALHLLPPPGFLELNSLLVSYFTSIFEPPMPEKSPGELSGDQDPRLSKIYRDNIKLISVIGHSFGVKVIFIPQILNYAVISGNTRWNGGEPFIWANDMKRLMGLMNDDLREAAAGSGAEFLDAPLTAGFTRDDFVDSGHFNAAGALKFARSIAGDVRRICQ